MELSRDLYFGFIQQQVRVYLTQERSIKRGPSIPPPAQYIQASKRLEMLKSKRNFWIAFCVFFTMFFVSVLVSLQTSGGFSAFCLVDTGIDGYEVRRII